MDLFTRAKSLLSRRRRLTAAIVAGLGACALAICPAVSPASAASAAPSFAPVFYGVSSFTDYQTGRCLVDFGGGLLFTTYFNCTPIEAAVHWGIYSTPYGGVNLVNMGTGDCLDGNYAGDVYTSPCNWNNTYQTWTFGGYGPAQTIQDYQTGRCLDSNYNGDAYTSPCDWNNTYENWEFSSYGAP